MKPILFATLALLATASLGGCASTDTNITPQMQDGKYIIHIVGGNHFSPANAKVPVGAVVRWIMDDTIVHNVYDSDNSPPAWASSETMQPGTTFEHTFATAGVFHYECTIHASTGMKGTITVG